MKKENKVVFGIFDTRGAVEAAVDILKASRFRNADISVLLPRAEDNENFAVTKGTKAPEGAAVGGGAGAVLGGALGWLVGAGVVSLAPAMGPFIVAGPLMSALAGAGAAGAVGGVVGALAGYGIPEYEAKRYEGYLKEGGILLSVHVDDNDWANRAMDILRDSGARDISCTREAKVIEKPKYEPPRRSPSNEQTPGNFTPPPPII